MIIKPTYLLSITESQSLCQQFREQGRIQPSIARTLFPLQAHSLAPQVTPIGTTETHPFTSHACPCHVGGNQSAQRKPTQAWGGKGACRRHTDNGPGQELIYCFSSSTL